MCRVASVAGVCSRGCLAQRDTEDGRRLGCDSAGHTLPVGSDDVRPSTHAGGHSVTGFKVHARALHMHTSLCSVRLK